MSASLPERQDARLRFQPIAEAYQKHRRRIVLTFVALVSTSLISFFAFNRNSLIPLAGCAILWLFFAILVFRTPLLYCPQCSRNLNPSDTDSNPAAPTKFCPECGSSSLEPARFRSIRCADCGKRIRERRERRSFRIRYCTGCGCHLHDTGV